MLHLRSVLKAAEHRRSSLLGAIEATESRAYSAEGANKIKTLVFMLQVFHVVPVVDGGFGGPDGFEKIRRKLPAFKPQWDAPMGPSNSTKPTDLPA